MSRQPSANPANPAGPTGAAPNDAWAPMPGRPPATRWKRRARALLMLLALAGLPLWGGLAGCAALDEQQRRWIFAPANRTWGPALQAAEAMAPVWIEHLSADDGPVRLHGLWAEAPEAAGGASAPVMLYLHGARWDVRGSALRQRRLQQLGFGVLAVDYRGFGQSTAVLPSEDRALADALAAWRWLRAQHPGRPAYLYGHSLGGAIAVALAARLAEADGPQPAGLLVEGSFTSIADVVAGSRWGWLPVGPLITQRFEAGEQIARVRSPVLVLHGSADATIALPLGRALYERAPAPKRWLEVPGGTHHNVLVLGEPALRTAMAELFGLPARQLAQP